MKNVIPEILSIDTNLNKVNGCYLKSFNFYKEVEKPNIFHFKIELKKDISLPSTYDFRHGYIFKKGRVWFYQRNLKLFSLKFYFDESKNTFAFNYPFYYFPFEIGKIFPAGRNIADLISLFLFLKGYLIFRGCAIYFQKKYICLTAPSFNGKTTLINFFLKKGGKYISEDILCYNFNENFFYPCAPSSSLFGGENSAMRKYLLNNEDKIFSTKFKVGRLFLFQNSTNEKFIAKDKAAFDYLILNSLFFLQNPLTRSYIFKERLWPDIINKINSLRNLKIKSRFIQTHNYNYSKVFNFEA